VIIELLLVLLLLLAALSLGLRSLINGVILLAVFSLICALLFYALKAPDLAIAEAAVGAGVATVLFVQAARKTGAPPG